MVMVCSRERIKMVWTYDEDKCTNITTKTV